MTVDLGRLLGVQPGMKFIVYKEGKIIMHPKTGEVLDVETIETGLVEIKDVQDKTATGVILQETAPNNVAYGSMVRSSTKESLDLPEAPENKTEEKQDSGERRGSSACPLSSGEKRISGHHSLGPDRMLQRPRHRRGLFHFRRHSGRLYRSVVPVSAQYHVGLTIPETPLAKGIQRNACVR